MTNADLREVVTLQLPVVGSDEAPSTAVTLEANVPAQIQAEGARQGVTNAQMGSALSYRITIRYRTDLTPHHEIVWGSRTLRIVGLWDVDGMRRWLTVRAVETT